MSVRAARHPRAHIGPTQPPPSRTWVRKRGRGVTHDAVVHRRARAEEGVGAAHAGGLVQADGLARHHVREARARPCDLARSRSGACQRLPTEATRPRRLGSRLYYEFTAQALDDAPSWERLADAVAVEVRRHTPSAPDAAAAAARGDAAPAAQGGVAAAPKPTALSTAAGSEPRGRGARAPESIAGGAGAVAGVSVSSTVNNNMFTIQSNSSRNNANTNNANSNNTSIVLL